MNKEEVDWVSLSRATVRRTLLRVESEDMITLPVFYLRGNKVRSLNKKLLEIQDKVFFPIDNSSVSPILVSKTLGSWIQIYGTDGDGVRNLNLFKELEVFIIKE